MVAGAPVAASPPLDVLRARFEADLAELPAAAAAVVDAVAPLPALSDALRALDVSLGAAVPGAPTSGDEAPGATTPGAAGG